MLRACDQHPIHRVDFEIGRARARNVSQQPLRHPALAVG